MNASGEPRHGGGDSGNVDRYGLDGGRGSAGGAPRPGGVGLARPARGLVRVLYTSNPFYMLSADLVFVGLRMSFGPGGPAAESWALAVQPARATRCCWRRPPASSSGWAGSGTTCARCCS